MKRRMRRIAAALVSLLACLLAVECALRLVRGPVQESNVTPVPAGLMQRSELPGVRYVLRPGAEGTQDFGSDPRGYFDPGATLTYRVNELGFRGPPVEREKPSGVLRIAMLGDSVLFGTGVRDEHLMSAVLQDLLVAEGRSAEVLNFGVPTYDTFEESVLLRRVVLDYQPDLAVFVFFLNDTNAIGGVAMEAFNATGQRSGLRRVSVLWDHLAAGLARRGALEQLVQAYRDGFADDDPGWLRAREALEKAAAAGQRRGVPLVLAIFPLLFRLDGEYPFVAIHEKLAATGRELGYHVLDLLPTLRGRDAPSLWVHPTNQHPSEEGHALVGRALHAFLEAEGLLDR